MAEKDAVTIRVYEEIRRQIMAGELAPGSALREIHLAESLGASRTPIREAIQRLRSDGLVVTRGRRGVEVPSWDEKRLEEVYRLRANLEGWSARQATPRLDDEDLAALQSLADAMTAEWARREAADLNRIAEMNAKFHEIVHSKAGGERYRETMATVVYPPLLHQVFFAFSPEEVSATLEEHHTIIRAFKARDADWAESITHAHILAGMHALLNWVQLDQNGG